MCKINKVFSSFRFLGDKYRLHVVEKNGVFYPIIEKKVFSLLSFSFWKKECTGKNKYFLLKDQARDLEKKGTLAVVQWMRGFAINRSMIYNQKDYS